MALASTKHLRSDAKAKQQQDRELYYIQTKGDFRVGEHPYVIHWIKGPGSRAQRWYLWLNS